MKKPHVRTRNHSSRIVSTWKLFMILMALTLTLGFVVTGCTSGFNLVDSETAVMPSDDIQFEPRDRDEEFKFETVLPTSLNVKLVPYAEDSKEADPFGSNEQREPTDLIYVNIRNQKGETVYTNGVTAGGTLDAELVLPSDPQDFTMTFSGPEYYERTISLERLHQFQKVTGTIYVPLRPVGKFLLSTSDEDADGVPDVYDAFPNNPWLAFSTTIPAARMLTIAFEDNYPELGDGDYNDFVATYFLEEAWAANGLVRMILGRVQALARVAGYNHRFGMMIDFDDYLGVMLVRNMDDGGNVTGKEWAIVEDFADVTLFQETKKAFSRPTSYVTLDNGYPDQLNSKGHCAQFAILLLWCGEGLPSSSGIGIKTEWNVYDPYLLAYDTGCDVHLIGKPPLPYSENPNDPDGFRDASGFPRALLVPSDWGYPIELTHIETAYDGFYLWRTEDGTEYNSWYMNPNEEHVIHIEPTMPRVIFTQELFDELKTKLGEYFPGYIIF
jgi:LruC domain-containing protein